jgi:hypothetical protein
MTAEPGQDIAKDALTLTHCYRQDRSKGQDSGGQELSDDEKPFSDWSPVREFNTTHVSFNSHRTLVAAEPSSPQRQHHVHRVRYRE